jgi:hypothetical protein
MTTDNTSAPRRPLSKRHAKRLLNVARGLRESKHPEQFRMSAFVSYCGTPACALGHYASRTDLQKSFHLLPNRIALFTVHQTNPKFAVGLAYDSGEVQKHFGITANEAGQLFSAWGCGEARTPIAAAEYIERFVRERTRAEQPNPAS